MGADIDDEGAGLDLDLVGAEQEQEIDAALCHRRSGKAVGARHEADIEAADPGGRGMQHGKAVPAVDERAGGDGGLRHSREDGDAVGPRQRALPDEPDLALQSRRGLWSRNEASVSVPAPR